MKLTDLKDKKLTELKEIAKQMEIEKSSSMSKDDLIKAFLLQTLQRNKRQINLLLITTTTKAIKWQPEF